MAKGETIRCESGLLYLYDLSETAGIRGDTHPGDQATFPPNIPHRFEAAPSDGAISGFSIRALDVGDRFTGPGVRGETEIVED